MNKNLEGIATAIFNLIWFGAWLYIIFGLGHSGWWILVPIVCHWATSDEKQKEDK